MTTKTGVKGKPEAGKREAGKRRTQTERRAATRATLIEAAIECILSKGYAGASAQVICARAGVSQGALFNHFGSKNDLLETVASEAFQRMFLGYTRQFGGKTLPTTAREAIEPFWWMFSRPEALVLLEMTVAARTDADLQRRFHPMFRRHVEQIRELARVLAPSDSSLPADRVIDFILDLTQGMGLTFLLDPDPRRVQRQLEFVVELLTSPKAAPPR